eukprot:GILJ01005529.1.p1 GENE.GILJ01005529.1~~GILJ01005529.1.p1  ORF type:complete len:638 (+),score=72.35 GILJ01005529.1:42-1916(+)
MAAILPIPGLVFACGRGVHGELGLGDVPFVGQKPGLVILASPRPVSTLKDVIVVWVAAGHYNSFALSAGGACYAWGAGGHTQLGNGVGENQRTPQRVLNFSYQVMTRVAAGRTHTVALTDTGEVYNWGHTVTADGIEQLIPDPSVIHGDLFLQHRKRLSDHDRGHIVQIAAGQNVTLALTVDGVVYSWGCSSVGRCGNGSVASVLAPQVVRSFAKVKISFIAAAYHHCMALTATGTLFTWGAGAKGQLGHGRTDSVLTPKLVEPLQKERVRLLAVGRFHSLAVTVGGDVYGWGSNEYGQLGWQETVAARIHTEPVLIPDLIDRKIIQISAGFVHSAAVNHAGDLFTWGSNVYGQCGIESTQESSRPSKLSKTSLRDLCLYAPTPVECFRGTRIRMAACGAWHTLILQEIKEANETCQAEESLRPPQPPPTVLPVETSVTPDTQQTDPISDPTAATSVPDVTDEVIHDGNWNEEEYESNYNANYTSYNDSYNESYDDHYDRYDHDRYDHDRYDEKAYRSEGRYSDEVHAPYRLERTSFQSDESPLESRSDPVIDPLSAMMRHAELSPKSESIESDIHKHLDNPKVSEKAKSRPTDVKPVTQSNRSLGVSADKKLDNLYRYPDAFQ